MAHLTYECVRLYSAVSIHLGHVHVIDEIDQLFGSWWTVCLASFLLQRFLHDLLQHHGGRIVVEGEGGDQHVFTETWGERGRGSKGIVDI